MHEADHGTMNSEIDENVLMRILVKFIPSKTLADIQSENFRIK